MYTYRIIFMLMFSVALYFALGNYMGILSGIVLGYSVGLALDEEKKNGE